MDYTVFSLPSGLRVIHRPGPSAVVYCGLRVKAGSRDERPGEEGLAHFCEHVTFKGTARRRASQVIQTLERVGGELNAFTTKDDTVFYAAVLRDHLCKAVDLLADMVFGSVYPEEGLEREKEVVCDEIESYNDTPAELIYDEFENLLFAGHPLGHSILGPAEGVRAFTRDDVLRFTRRLYRPSNAVLFIDGGAPLQTAGGGFTPLGHRLRRLLTALPAGESPKDAWPELPPLTPTEGGRKVLSMDTHQTHVMLGTRAYGLRHPRHTALFLLNNLLGGPGMSARLNMSLRERRGLVYTVESTLASYADTGTWAVYFGCDPKDTERCLRLVRRELERLCDKPLSPRQLQAAQRQLCGQLCVAADQRDSFALGFAKEYLHEGRLKDMAALCRRVERVTPVEVQAVARELFDASRLRLLVIE